MKVVTWNIDFKTDKSKLWDYIDKEINPDILLLQECRNFPSIYQGIGEQIGGTRSWGSVVLSKKYTLEPIYLPNHVGWVAGARIEVNNFKFLVFSIHAKLKDIGRYVVPHLKNIFNDIMESAGDTQNIIIGGDFNAARLYDSIYFQPVEASHNKFFDWLETDLNFISAHARFNEKEVQTMRGNAKHPYQNDHIYVSRSMSELLTNSQVLADDVISNLSDHNPVAAEFNLKD